MSAFVRTASRRRASAQLMSSEKSCQTFDSEGSRVFSTATRCTSEGAVSIRPE